jgi:hypothetical protein
MISPADGGRAPSSASRLTLAIANVAQRTALAAVFGYLDGAPEMWSDVQLAPVDDREAAVGDLRCRPACAAERVLHLPCE